MSVSREELRSAFINSYDRYTNLFQTFICRTADPLPGYDKTHKRPFSLGPERAFYNSNSAPPLFYFGHTAAIYIQKMLTTGLLKGENWSSKVDHTVFTGSITLFAKDDINWNLVHEIIEFRSSVRKIVLNVVDNFPLLIQKGHPSMAIIEGVEYENKYFEMVYPVVRNLPLELVHSIPSVQITSPTIPTETNPLIKIAEKRIIIHDHSWASILRNRLDNKIVDQYVDVPSFTVSQYLVTNKEYLSFVESSEYDNKKSLPKWWRYNDGKWFLRLLDREIEMPWEWPVELNLYEVEAFLRWKSQANLEYSFRLLNDDEWHSLFQDSLSEKNIERIDNDAISSSDNTNKDLSDMICNWKLTSGFNHTYDLTTIPCFDNPKFKIQCGSWVSNANDLDDSTPIYVHFTDHQLACFRYVVESTKEVYKYPEDKDERINSHYHNADEIEDNYILIFGNQQRIEIHKKLVQFVQMHNLPEGLFVDIGGGSGETMQQIYQECQLPAFRSQHINRTFGVVEPSAEYLSQLNNPNILAINKGANEWTEEMKLTSSSAALILCKEVIHHLNESFLNDIPSILVNRGSFVIITRPKYNIGFPFGTNGHRTWIASYGDSMDIDSVSQHIKNMGCFEISRCEFKYPIKVKKEDWFRLNSESPIFSNIAVLSESERMDDLHELQQRYRDVSEIKFNDTLIIFQAVKIN